METKQVIIVGGGPAAYAAATYTARAQLESLVFVGERSGGQLMSTTMVENWPGSEHGIMGPELMLAMRAQAERFGAKIVEENVVSVDFAAPFFRVNDKGAQSVIIATGAESLPLGVTGEQELTGRGVSYCAVCDGAFFRNKKVFVVGGGDAAMEDTLALTKFASEITVIHRRETFRASKIMQERVINNPKVKVWFNREVIKVIGDGIRLTGIIVKDKVAGKVTEYEAEGLFVAIGHKPATDFLRGHVDLDEKGYVKTMLNYGQADWLDGYPTMTSVAGVFAAGDNVDFRYRQAATAAGFGVMAALDAEKWLESR
jgi:thioredoxin reductase (NADPH)